MAAFAGKPLVGFVSGLVSVWILRLGKMGEVKNKFVPIFQRFKTKGEAQRFEVTVRQKCSENPAWSIKSKDRRRLSELLQLWCDLHGHSPRDASRRLSKLLQLSARLGDPVATALDASSYCKLAAEAAGGGISGKALNNELGYIREVLNELKNLGQIDYGNRWPVRSCSSCKSGIVVVDDRADRRASRLYPQPLRQPAYRAGDAALPGCRCSMVRGGKLSAQRLQGNVVTYAGTKSGKVRHVPIPTELAD